MSVSPTPLSTSQATPQTGDVVQVSTTMASVARTLQIEGRGLDALSNSLEGGLADAMARAAALIEKVQGTVIVTGIGKSGHIGCKLAATLASTGTYSHFVHPAEASHGDLGMIRTEDLVLAMSWSGDTPELSDVISHTRRFCIPLVGMTSRVDSLLGRSADVGLFLPVSEEACPNGLAPTTSTTMQLVIGDALAILLLERRGFSATDFHRNHPGGRLGARLTQVHQIMHRGSKLPLVSDQFTLSGSIVEMTSKGFGIAGVVDSTGRLVGVISDGDLRRSFKNGFVDQKVSAVMGRKPHTVAPDVLAVEVLNRMNTAAVTSIFVIEDERPVGLVHVHDLLRLGLM